MSHALAHHPVTIAEFEAFTDTQPETTRWELVDGHILAMTNPTGVHGQIVANLGIGIRPAAQDRGCWVNFGGLRIQASSVMSDITATIPDLTIACGPVVTRNWITDPVIVVEVLSPSTIDFDRGPKLDFYKSLPSVQDIILAYQDQVRIEHYRRTDEGWSMDPLTQPSASLTLDGLPSEVPLSDIYAGTGLA